MPVATRPWWWAVIICTAVASAVIPAGIMAADPTSASTLRVRGMGSATPSAPPGVAFSIIWPILYALAGGTLAYQGLTARTPLDWAGFALLVLAILMSWAWPAVFRASVPGSSWLILGIFLVAALGVVFWGTGASSPSRAPGPALALWVPLLSWLLFALMLSVQTSTVVSVAGAGPGSGAGPAPSPSPSTAAVFA